MARPRKKSPPPPDEEEEIRPDYSGLDHQRQIAEALQRREAMLLKFRSEFWKLC